MFLKTLAIATYFAAKIGLGDSIKDESKAKITGLLQFDHISYFNKFPDSIRAGRNQGILVLKYFKSLNKYLSVQTSFRYREDFSDPSRNLIVADEYYIDVSLKKMDLRVGKQRIFWGRADVLNFTNNINPYDFTDFLDVRKEEMLGVIGINLKYYLYKNFFIQGIFIPVFQTSMLPNTNSVWNQVLPDKILLNQPSPALVPAYYIDFGSIDPRKDLSSAQFAFKFDGKFNRFDFSISYYKGYSSVPEITVSPLGPVHDGVLLGVQKVYIPWEVAGLDFETSTGPFTWRGEGGYFMPKGQLAEIGGMKENFLRYSLGGDYTMPIGNNYFLLLAEFIHEIVPDGPPYAANSLNHFFQKTLVTRAQISLQNNLQFTLQYVQDFKNQSYFVRPQISYPIIDNLNITMIADILGKRKLENGLFARYDNNDRIQMQLKYSY